MQTPGKLFVPAQDGSIQSVNTGIDVVNDSINDPAYGPALDVSVTDLPVSGIPPIAPGIVGGEQILQNPGGSPYTIYIFPSPGKIWAASVSLSAGFTGGSGTNLLYARVYIVGGRTLVYCEVGTAGTVAYGVNGDANTFPGFTVAPGTTIALDVNNGTGVAGGLIRAGGILVGSIP